MPDIEGIYAFYVGSSGRPFRAAEAATYHATRSIPAPVRAGNEHLGEPPFESIADLEGTGTSVGSTAVVTSIVQCHSIPVTQPGENHSSRSMHASSLSAFVNTSAV